MSSKLFVSLLIGSLCFAVILGGCGESQRSSEFTQDGSTTYKSTIENFRIITIEGPSVEKIKNFKGGRAGSKIEMVFSQQIESVDEAGNSLANITIKQLKFHSKSINKPGVEFDSTIQQEQNHALAKLVGTTYKITLSPQGKVIDVIDTSQAKSAIQGIATGQRLASYLLQPEQITVRHSIAAFPGEKKILSEPKGKWSSIKSFNLGMLGTKSYERIYALKEIDKTADGQIATIEMNGVPSSKMEQGVEESISLMGPFGKGIDSVETYTGQLVINLDNGKVEKYSENLDAKWVIIVNSSKETSQAQEPDVWTMKFINTINLESLQ